MASGKRMGRDFAAFTVGGAERYLARVTSLRGTDDCVRPTRAFSGHIPKFFSLGFPSEFFSAVWVRAPFIIADSWT